MRAATATATPMGDGSPRQCVCGDRIAIGSPVASNAHGVDCHPQCADLTPRQAQAQARGAAAVPQRQRYTGPVAAPVAARDLGDEVADRLEALMGITQRIELEHTADRHVAHALTPRPTASRRDLGDEVADRIEQKMFGKIREVAS